MPKKLVIVESPAKAITLRRILGAAYRVEASVGHIRDLPENRKGLPKDLQSKWWADYAVDVDNGFEPYYQVSSGKEKAVRTLKEALKDAHELILATDEDREGESISWHLLEVLKPRKGVPVMRIAFHEITKDAILQALRTPRPIDEQLVKAQETRRILDRLYGYTLSPVLWRKVARDLSAGRVQTPAVKLVVDREKQRRAFQTGEYWDLRARLESQGIKFEADLRFVDGSPVVSGTDFDDSTGTVRTEGAVLLDERRCEELRAAADRADGWKVARVETKDVKDRAPAPFRTTTLQQEANRKFGWTADRTMRVAQDLYEGVDIGGGERVGLITYMRTDSLNLAKEAVESIRKEISRKFGDDYLPAKPNRYSSKVANAQEAHEAIRPSSIERSPESLKAALQGLSKQHYDLYELIYRRTLACQMLPADAARTTVEIEVATDAGELRFAASGKRILFPGFLLAYVEGSDSQQEELEKKESPLPELAAGDLVAKLGVESKRHETQPPPRYTDATLIKALEDLGIGRPSTYATILSVIVDRGYVRNRGRTLIPTWLAFLTMEVLEGSFHEFVDLKFTAKMDEALDEVANGKQDPKKYLETFFLRGNGAPGLRPAVESRKDDIPFPVMELGTDPESGERVIVRLGKDGHAFLQKGPVETKQFANVPDDLEPDQLTLSKALELLSQGRQQEAEGLGVHPESGRRLLLRKKNGYYLEVERTDDEIEGKVKPQWISLPSEVDPRELSQDDLDYLCGLPSTLGQHPATHEPITFRIGRYGPYVQSGQEMRSVEDWRAGKSMSVEEAVELLSKPKQGRKSGGNSRAPIQEFPPSASGASPIRVMSGFYGPYVTDGKVNATVPKGTDPSKLTLEEALELLRKKAAQGPSRRGKGRQTKRGKAKPATRRSKKG
ncbi:MAG: type I DNA topoisomerase [Fimbriimonadaceae bacterium]|nr:type I DNA topoisomerase [Fimbriimonadaceae bacterium]